MRPRPHATAPIAGGALLAAAALAGGCAPHAAYWLVETDDGKSSVLVGTMHAEADASALAPELDDRLRAARVVVTEADVRAIPPDELLAALTLPADVSVREAVAPEDWTAIGRALSGALPSGDVERLQPWFLEGVIVENGLPAVERIDEAIVARAVSAGVPLAFFESWQTQVELLNGLGFDDGLSILLPTARDPEATVAEHLRWADAYVEGDVEAMTALGFDPALVAARPAFYEDVVFRHEGWLDEAERQVRDGDAFIAAGFLHMLTDRGLPALLEARGLRVTER